MSKSDSELKPFDLQDRLISFSVRIIRVAESLPNTRTGNHIKSQMLRCGTSPAANYAEAQSAESVADFVHKLKIALKELRETSVWLLLIIRASLLKSEAGLQSVILECDELKAILFQSIRTTQRKKDV